MTIRWVMCAIAFWGATLVRNAPAQDLYDYADDFSTDRARTESFTHATFLDSLPDVPPATGYLVYGDPGDGGRALGFYKGSNGADAYLFYRLPRGATMTSVTSGHLAFDLVVTPGAEPMMAVSGVCTQGQDPFIYSVITTTGHYEFPFSGSLTCERIALGFVGSGFHLDNLYVTIDYYTPASETTWGGIKALFR
jgi:hypothetical protein